MECKICLPFIPSIKKVQKSCTQNCFNSVSQWTIFREAEHNTKQFTTQTQELFCHKILWYLIFVTFAVYKIYICSYICLHAVSGSKIFRSVIVIPKTLVSLIVTFSRLLMATHVHRFTYVVLCCVLFCERPLTGAQLGVGQVTWPPRARKSKGRQTGQKN